MADMITMTNATLNATREFPASSQSYWESRGWVRVGGNPAPVYDPALDTYFGSLLSNPASATGTAGRAVCESWMTARARERRRQFDVTDYGATQGKYLTGCSMAAGSPVLTAPGYIFTTADVGKVIGVRGAVQDSADYSVLANDGVLVTTIASVSGGVATLADPALISTSAFTGWGGGRVVFGAPIDQAMRDAYADAKVLGGDIVIPAGVWVAATQVKFTSGVSVIGAGKIKTKVFYVHADDGTSYNTTPFLSYASSGVDPETGLQNDVSMRDWCIDGQFFVGTAGYSFRAKLIIVDHTLDSYVSNMAILNCPATAIGYDVSRRCIIEGNTVVNAGRFAFTKGVLSGSSGSAIGVFVQPTSGDVTMIIRDNFLYGNWTSAAGTGRSGIHIEGDYAATTDSTEGSHLITGNVVEGFFVGIRDSGAMATRITSNDVRKCQRGILAGSKGSTGSRVPTATLMQGNVVRDGVLFAPLDGSTGVSSGIEVSSFNTTVNPALYGRILIMGNEVHNIPGDAIYLNGAPAALTGIRVVENILRGGGGYGVRTAGALKQCGIERNYIEGNGGYGIRIAGTLDQFVVENNRVYGNNTAGGGANGLSINSGVVWTGGRLVGNELADIATTPTQTNVVQIETGAVLTGVTRDGNTGDKGDVSESYKRVTTAVSFTNTATVADVAGAVLAMEAGKTYRIDAVIEYVTTAAAGLKLTWSLPTGSTMFWEIEGPGATTAMLSATSTTTLAGIDGATSIRARITGVITVSTTAGNLQLRAAQATNTADTTTIQTKTFIELRQVG